MQESNPRVPIVSSKTALKLNNLGFKDISTLCYLPKKEGEGYKRCRYEDIKLKDTSKALCAPDINYVIDWYRLTSNIFIYAYPKLVNSEDEPILRFVVQTPDFIHNSQADFRDYYKCLEAGINDISDMLL